MVSADLVIEGFVKKQIYPKTLVKNAGEYAIFSFDITKTICGKVDNRVKDKWYREGSVTLKGTVPELSGSTKYRVFADLTEDKRYGWGYSIKMMNVCANFESDDGVKKFLSYVITDTQIENIFKEIGNPISVLDSGNVGALCVVKGIGEKTAQRIIEKYENAKDSSGAYSVLYDYGLTKKMIDKLVSTYKSVDTAVAKVRGNPYILIDEVDGFGWAKTDAMALRYGIPVDSDFRISAFIKYFFKNLAETEGHTWVPLDTLVSNLRGLVPGIKNEKLQRILREGVDNQTLYYKKDTRQIGLMRYRRLEERICNELVRIRDAESSFDMKYIDETIKECEESVGFEYTDEQIDAIKTICSENVVLLSANAGCGKSSLMYPITRIFRKNGVSFSQCTLSGKASLNLQQITSEEGQTIHKLLGWNRNEFIHNAGFPLKDDAVILDEVSMVGGELFYSLIQSIKSGSKLIMIGDPGQLESIGLCNLIADMSNSHAVSHVHLTKIFRQAAMSGIITDSLKIYNQQPFIPKNFVGHVVHGELNDFDIYISQEKTACLSNIVDIYKSLHFKESIPNEDILIVAAKRCSGGLSSAEINQKVQETIKFDDGPTVTKEYSDNGKKYTVVYHVGDRVLVTENDYNATNAVTGSVEPIFNGNIGTIVAIEDDGKSMVVNFPQGNILVSRSKYSGLQLGYAITTHKSQGSGFKYVIAVADPGAYTMLTKEFLYTAVTRAKKHCYLIGTPASVDTCVKTTRVVKKQTWLSGLLSGIDSIEVIKRSKTDDSEEPADENAE